MNSVVGIVSAGALLLVLAGAQKLVDPWPAAAALRQTGLPGSRRLVRMGAAVEVLVGAGFLVAGSTTLSLIVAGIYLGFGAFVVVALRRGVTGSCGCFGRDDTPPSWMHVWANTLVALAASAYGTGSAAAPFDLVTTASFEALALGCSTAVLAGVLVVVYSVAPRTMAAVAAR